jgi:hypothetical protein
MRRLTVLLLFLLVFAHPIPASAQGEVWISAPAKGSAVQGVVNISGQTITAGFVSASVYFAYADNPTDTWFLIMKSDEPVTEGVLTAWDTSTITDGEYSLRLEVILNDGTRLESQVAGIRVRNYSAVETPSGGQTTVEAAATISPTVTPGSIPETPTPISGNPAAVTRPELESSLIKGSLASLLAFAGIGLYIALRRLGSRH